MFCLMAFIFFILYELLSHFHHGSLAADWLTPGVSLVLYHCAWMSPPIYSLPASLVHHSTARVLVIGHTAFY